MSFADVAPWMRRVRASPTAVISDQVRALVAAGREVVDLGEGELDFVTPEPIHATAVAATSIAARPSTRRSPAPRA